MGAATFVPYGGCSKNEMIIYWVLYVVSSGFFVIMGGINVGEV